MSVTDSQEVLVCYKLYCISFKGGSVWQIVNHKTVRPKLEVKSLRK